MRSQKTLCGILIAVLVIFHFILPVSGQNTSDQICLSLGRYEVEGGWELKGGGKEIFYTGPENKAVKFFVLCDQGNKIRETIPLFPADKINLDYVRHCKQFNPENEKPVCAVVLAEAKTIPNPQLQPGFAVLFLMMLFALVPMILV